MGKVHWFVRVNVDEWIEVIDEDMRVRVIRAL